MIPPTKTNKQALKAMELEAPITSTDLGWRCAHQQTIRRPAAGAAPVAVRVKFWANGKVWFRIRGAGDEATADWKPAEASKRFGGGVWSAYDRRTAASVEFKLQAGGHDGDGASAAEVSGSQEKEEDACAVLEWKAGAWFGGLSVYPSVTVE